MAHREGHGVGRAARRIHERRVTMFRVPRSLQIASGDARLHHFALHERGNAAMSLRNSPSHSLDAAAESRSIAASTSLCFTDGFMVRVAAFQTRIGPGLGVVSLMRVMERAPLGVRR